MEMNTDTLIIALVAFTVFMFVFGIYKVFIESKVSAKENIEKLSGQRTVNPINRATGDGEIILKRKKDDRSWKAKLENKLERANMLIKTEEFVMMSFVSAGVGALLGFFITGQNLLFGILIGVAAYFAPTLYLKLKTMMRMGKAESQFADVLDNMVNCFKTGYGFTKAIQVVSENYDDPWGTEFGKMAAEISLGSSQEDVLNNLARRVPNPDVDLFVTAMMIQKETGGNMSELLGNLSNTCRERFKLKRKVSAISAQGKLSAGIVSAIPPLLMLIMWLFLPGPVGEFVSNPIGIFLMIVAAIWMLVGVKVLFKIVQIEV